VPAAESLPHLGGLALASYRGELPDETELHSTSSLKDAFDQATSDEILKRALGLQKVNDRFARGRVTPIGVSRRGETEKGERRTYLVVGYDYTANVAVEISLDEHGELLEISDEHYQPAPVQKEIDRAIELARNDARLSKDVAGLVGMAIPFSGANDEFANKRVLEVLFGCRAERLPRYRAWVDLATESVLHAGGTCDCCTKHDEAQS
jgi:hypothetical protein